MERINPYSPIREPLIKPVPESQPVGDRPPNHREPPPEPQNHKKTDKEEYIVDSFA